MSYRNNDHVFGKSYRHSISLLFTVLAALLILLLIPAAGHAQTGNGGQSAPEDGNLTSASVATDANGNEYAEGELLVTYKDEFKAASEKPKEGEVISEVPEIGAQLVELGNVKAEEDKGERKKLLEDKKEEIEQDADVESVELNYLLKPDWVPNDPMFRNYRYNQRNTLPVVRASQGWDIWRGSNALIAVIDTGADRSHVELSGSKIAAGKNFLNGTTNIRDDTGHGTNVASIASANTNNGYGIAGAAPSSRLLIGKVVGTNGRADNATVAKAAVWSANRGADAINISISGPGRTKALENAVNYAWNKGALPVASSGNTGNSTPQYPAAYSKAVSVGAVSGGGGKAGFSSYGPSLDLMAPGTAVWGASPGNRYASYSGTSQAAPHAAALVALLESQNPRRGSAAKLRLMRGTAKDMGSRGRDDRYGYGRINYEAALRAGR